MSSITPEQQTDLLFKQFNVVANTQQSDGYGIQPYLFRDNILNNQILSQTVPSTLPNDYSIANLDLCGNITEPDGSLNLGVIGYPQLTYYKKLQLTQVPNSNGQAWWCLDGNGINILQDTIPFKFDETVVNAYDFQLYGGGGPPFINIGRDEPGTLWLMDNKTGIIEFYEDPVILQAGTGTSPPINNTNPPFLSFIAYTGTKGITGGGGGGGDASFNIIDVSNIILDGNNLMQKFSAEPWDSQAVAPSFQKEYIISEIPVVTANTMGYFTLQLGPPEYHNINFIAGIHPSGSTGVIKILSNINKNKYGFNRIRIITDSGNTTFYLTINIDLTGVGVTQFDYLNITLVNNNENMSTSSRDWKLKQMIELPSGSYTPIADISINLIEPVYGMTTQPEYFQNDLILGPNSKIIPDSGNFTPIIPGLGTVDICGGLYVLNETYLNQDTGIRGQLDVCANIVGNGNLDIDGSGNFDGNLYAANTPIIEYISYDNTNFSSNSSTLGSGGSWQTIAQIYPISPLSAQVDTRAAYAIFEIVDRSNNDTAYKFQDNITCMISFTTGECVLTILSSNPKGNTTGNIGYIGNIRLRCGKSSIGLSSLDSANLQIKRFCDEPGTGTTDVRVRMYHNFQPMLLPREFTPFVLTSTSLTLTGTITPNEFDLLNYITGFKCSTTKRQYVDKSTIDSLFMGGDIDMGSNNIVNANIISKSTAGTAPRIEFDTTGINLFINENVANDRIVMGDDNNASKQIYMRVNPDVTLDMNSIEISNVSNISSTQTIDISANNILINASSNIDLSANTIDLSANTYNIDIRDGDMKIQQDISTNEIWIKNIGGSGYAKSRQNDAGLPNAGGWPSTSTNAGFNTIIKAGRWVDMGGLAPVNMFTLPNTSPWNDMSNSGSVIQDGRSLIGMNLRSTYNYFLKREAQGNLNMGTNKIFVPELDFTTKTPTEADSLFSAVGDVGFVKDPSGGLVQYNNSQLNMVNSDITRYSFSAVGFTTGTNTCGLSNGGSTTGWTLNPSSTAFPQGTISTSGTSIIFNGGTISSPGTWTEWKNSFVVEPGDVTLNNISNITKKFYEMPQSTSKGHIVGGAFYGPVGLSISTSACIQFSSSMANNNGYVTFRLAGSGSTFTPNTGCDFLTINKNDTFTGGRFSIKNNFRDSTYVELPDEVTIDVIVRVYAQTNPIGSHGYITLTDSTCHLDFMINHLLKL